MKGFSHCEATVKQRMQTQRSAVSNVFWMPFVRLRVIFFSHTFTIMHIISYYGPGCSGSSYVTHMLHSLLIENKMIPCPIDGEVLRSVKFNKIIPNGNPEDKVSEVIRYCEKLNSTAIVFDVTNEKDVSKYESKKDALQIFKFNIYRSNLLYYKICQIMDFNNSAKSYRILPRNHTEPVSFKYTRSRPDDMKVHLNPSELLLFIQEHSSHKPGSYAVEDLSAYEYGNQFALHSVMQWKSVAYDVGLEFRNFYANHMRKSVSTRHLRLTSDIVENSKEVQSMLFNNGYAYFMIE